MLLKQLCNWLVGLHTVAYLDFEAFGADKEEEVSAYFTTGLRIVMTKSVKTLRMTRLRRRVLLRARSRGQGGARNKDTFCKV